MTIEVRNPANPTEIAGTYQTTAPHELDAIVQKAQKAQAHWAQLPQPERGIHIRTFMQVLEKRSDEIALSMTQEMGKTLGESKAEVGKAIGEGRMTADRAGAPIGTILPSQVAGATAYTTRRGRGVIVGINPWNFPFSTPMRKAIPALLYGNAIILKPATLSPGALVLMQEAATQVLPADLLQVVIGSGEIGQALCEHPGVDAISFTGSVSVGRKVATAAVSHFAEVSLELGGKNPVILNDTPDLEHCLDQIITAAFAVSGQRCTSISRVIVNEALADEVVNGLAIRANAIIPADGTLEGTQMGPLASKEQLRDVSDFVSRACTQGARIVAGGTKITTPTNGYFYAPTILSDVTPDMEVAREEVFGPVLSVLTYRTIDQALEIANDVVYGLTSCLYSQQLPVVERFLAESQSGMMHVNAGSFPQNHLPFVGIKHSSLGVGGSNGASTIQFYTTEHTIYKQA